ncbi:MAG: chemotaxis protein CheD [Terriglobales bacterium]
MADSKPCPPHPGDPLPGMPLNMPVVGARQRVFLLPGQLHVSPEPTQICTILGSCVSICLWDPQRLAGGMNHFLLPASREGEPASLRFADVATTALLEKLLLLGCRPRNLRAKIFGGSFMFQNQDRYTASLGANNVAAALWLMKNAGIPVAEQDTGGIKGRKIVFNTDDGAAWSRRV